MGSVTRPLKRAEQRFAASVFLWEWFTTKPFVDSGEVRFIGSVYSTSPCRSLVTEWR